LSFDDDDDDDDDDDALVSTMLALAERGLGAGAPGT
jgi:hypothetical protein